MMNCNDRRLYQSFVQHRSQPRILLVEDNDNNRVLLSDYLQMCGYRISSIAAGGGFTQAVTQFHPDLILLDLKLPDIDGFELLRLLQSHTLWRRIPVVVVSALAFQDDQDRAFQYGARRYLVKPVRLAYLREVIEEEIRGQEFF